MKATEREEFLAEQLNWVLGLVEMTGRAMANDAAVIAEHGGTNEQLREVIRLHGRGGESMLRAVKRTQEKLAKKEGE